MSQSHLRKPKLQSRPSIWVGTAIVVFAIAVMITEILFIRWRNSNVEHVTATGTVLETRIDPVGTGNSVYGGYIYYQLMAHVQYSAQAGDQVRWMPASEIVTSREILVGRQATASKACFVAWEPKHPESPRCEFVLPSLH